MAELALFPLRTVLFPGGTLPLRIFEPRYLGLVSECMRTGGVFGVVLLLAGGEIGPVGRTAAVGTSARIADFSKLEDGTLGIVCRGEQRFRVESAAADAAGLLRGRVQWLDGAASNAVAEAWRRIDAAPLAIAERQQYLETLDPAEAIAALERD